MLTEFLGRFLGQNLQLSKTSRHPRATTPSRKLLSLELLDDRVVPTALVLNPSGPTVVTSVVRVSTAADDAQGNNHSDQSSVFSPDGTWVAFRSTANNLVPGDTNNSTDIFVKNLLSGEIKRVSTATDGTQGNNISQSPVFSPDGTRIAFQSYASNLVPGDTNGNADIFVKNLASGVITRVSIAADGTQGNLDSSFPVFSPDGTRVAFYSAASNLVPGDTNGTYDIFVKDLASGVITRVSTAADGTQGNNGSYTPVFSPDGTRVAFESDASSLVPNVTNGFITNVYIKDLVSGAITLVNTASDGTPGNNHAFSPVFSPDGTQVAFHSAASNLVPGNTNTDYQIFVKDLASGVITRISTSANGTQGNAGSFMPVFSPDGTRVAFESSASNLVPGDTNGTRDIFVKHLASGAITRINAVTNTTQGNGFSAFTVFSPDGNRVAFMSNASNLVPGDTNGTRDIFVATLATALTIPENNTAVAQVQGQDPGVTLVYSLAQNNDWNLFSINPNTGVLTFTTAPDFEAPADANQDNVYLVTVQASDGTHSFSQNIAVTVQNIVNELPPTISGLTPNFGSVAGFNTVTITGTGFTGATSVKFGATNAASYVVDSDTQITATTPAGSGVVNVSVITPNGTSANTAADDYTYITKLTNVVIGDGTGQRSTIRKITLTFNGNIDVGGVGGGSIAITNQANVPIPGLNINVTGAGTNTLVLTFSDTNPNDSVNNFNSPTYGTPASTGPVTYSSLVDGLYRLKLDGASLLSGGVAVDIDANGTAGGTRNDDFHRLFGDKDGDQVVGTFDYYPSLINAINKELGEPGFDAAWDYDNDGVIGSFDFFPHLSARFNAEIF